MPRGVLPERRADHAITLEGVTLLRPIDPADTSLVEQVCQIANELDEHGKLNGKRLAAAVDALNTLGGTWQLAPIRESTNA